MTGWTVPQIDALEIEDYEMMVKYWSKHPPVHLMLASFFGIESKGGSEKDDRLTWENESIEGLLSRWGAGGGTQVRQGQVPGAAKFKKNG